MKFLKSITTTVICSAVLLSGCGTDSAKPAASISATPTPQATIAPAADNSLITAATEQYRKFAIEQCDLFIKSTTEFVNAIKSGDIEKAKELYAPSRMFYERIEPIAEALGDLDPNIDAREGDVSDDEWRGFHRLEKALWVDKTTKDQETFADQLLADAKLLRAKVETVEIDSTLLVTGAVELLNEVSSSKVTGEEERYSHTDLYDFAANVEGANKIFELLKPAIDQKDPSLATKIETQFKSLTEALAPYKKGDGYVLYTDLTPEQTKKLSQELDALAEPLSNIGKIVEG
ncbi:EfeM/EfeO family lipoprotein [Paenibacillus albiflavus]|uniref:EfeM/EfeO family lipoprotein n=1 Tax=Paenibacillus albiflavus TaxID=2545760 RepID=A0A4R4EE92_9BACL|nr:iron uptake system protein EfeO [Paenibacillus albiflavus]TCZ77767.1 EfeM/EfeO family lipoprotein [Paenibacillus albiflavus]